MPTQDFLELLGPDFKSASPAATDELIGFKQMTGVFPADFHDFLAACNGGEGWIGESYLMLWGAQECLQYNVQYQVDEYALGIVLFGSDGCGEAYAFDVRNGGTSVVSIPFIGISLKLLKPIAVSFMDFLKSFRRTADSTNLPALEKNLQTPGLEVFDIHPIILGGNPTDPKNKRMVNRQEHIELVRFWNRHIKAIKK